ncbi:MAG TPA: urease accessory protein UreD [Vicinamibacterales bacterium]|jgi:urease accessory protein
MFPQMGQTRFNEAVLINTAGGVAGGDRLATDVTAHDGACMTVTSQTAERIYRALDEPARISTVLTVCRSAKLAWCPQETIVFDRARVRRQTHIAVSSGAEVLALEWMVLGRAARGERVASGELVDSWRVEKDGRLVWADSLRITDDLFPHIHRSALLADCTAVATLVFCGTDLEQRLQCLRDSIVSLTCHAAATRVGGVIIARLAATAPSTLRAGLRTVLEQFDHAWRPGPFGVPKMWSC